MERRRRRALLAVGGAIFIALCAGLAWLLLIPHTIVLTRDDLQREVDKAFPIEKRELIATIRFADPQVMLQDGSDRIGLSVGVSAEAPGIDRISGTVAADGEVRYDAIEGALYLDSARLVGLEAPGLSQEDVRAAEPILSSLLASYLSRVPIYRLKEPKKKQLRSVIVRRGRLYVTFAP